MADFASYSGVSSPAHSSGLTATDVLFQQADQVIGQLSVAKSSAASQRMQVSDADFELSYDHFAALPHSHSSPSKEMQIAGFSLEVSGKSIAPVSSDSKVVDISSMPKVKSAVPASSAIGSDGNRRGPGSLIPGAQPLDDREVTDRNDALVAADSEVSDFLHSSQSYYFTLV